MWMVLRFIHQLWIWLIYLPLVLITMLIAASLTILLVPLIGASRAGRLTALPWARMVTQLLPARVELSGHWPLDEHCSYVVVANHQSQFDIPVLFGWLGLDLRWVMKREVMRIPGLGYGAKTLGHIPIDRRRGSEAREQIRQAVSGLSDGIGLMFFPEGTRSRDGRLLPFKSGAFHIAVEQQLPLLPITIIGSREIMAPGSLMIRPGTIRVVVHPPISTTGMDETAVSQLKEQVRQWMAGQLAGATADTPVSDLASSS
ncbi:MAG: lysophospholipid acyltransferase family protein [Wenzhouxiangellaceae bacterium]